MVSKNPNMLPNMITKIIDMCIFFKFGTTENDGTPEKGKSMC